MAAPCSKCKLKFKKADKILTCKGEECGTLHVGCSGLDEEVINELFANSTNPETFCTQCLSLVETKSRSNSNSSFESTESETNKVKLEDIAASLKSFRAEVLSEFGDVNNKLEGVAKDVSVIKKTITDHGNRIKSLEKNHGDLTNTVNTLKATVENQAAVINKMEQEMQKNDIIVFGIPLCENVEPSALLVSIFKAVTNQKATPSLSYCYYIKNKSSGENLSIMAGFSNYSDKMEIMKAKNKMSTATVKIANKPVKLDTCFIYDKLTKNTMMKYQELRADVKAGKLGAVKIFKGQIQTKQNKEDKKWLFYKH